MPSEKQVELFDRLTAQKEFPAGVDLADLREKFRNVPNESASAWIEKALGFPDKTDVPPPF